MTALPFPADDGLLRSFRGSLVHGVSRVVGDSDAEDVVQDAFERALRSRSVRPDTDPRPWLRRITRNTAVDVLRRRARRPDAPAAELSEESAEHVAMRHESRSELDRALQTLSPSHRRAIVMHDLEGYSNLEIASIENVPYHTVRTRLFRARRAMRDQLMAAAA